MRRTSCLAGVALRPTVVVGARLVSDERWKNDHYALRCFRATEVGSCRKGDAGFTLIETLVALAILSMSAVALLGATEAHIARIGALESRAAAQWVAENHLAELMLGVLPEKAPPMLGIAFAVDDTRLVTGDPDLARVDITVTDAADGVAYGRLTGFLDTAVGG